MKPSKLLLLLLVSAAGAAATRAEIVERVIARVNGDVVTLSEFEARQLAAVQQARVAPDQVEAYLRANNARLLQEAIDDMLILQRGVELGIQLRPEYIEEVVEGIKKENNIADDAELQRQLRREGMSIEELKRNVERSIIRRQVLTRELEPKTQVTEAELLAEYEKNQASYARLEGVRVHEIVVADKDLAEDIARRARAGEDFAALARQHSTAPSRAAGGDLGRLQRGEMNAALEGVAFGLAEGGVSDPIATDDGYRILRATEREAASVVPFEDVKAEIARRLGQERANRAYEAYVEGLRKTAITRTMVTEVPLQVSLPAAGTGTMLPPSAAGTTAAPEAEIVITPQARPERVAPPAAVGTPAAPAPSPSPSPVPR